MINDVCIDDWVDRCGKCKIDGFIEVESETRAGIRGGEGVVSGDGSGGEGEELGRVGGFV